MKIMLTVIEGPHAGRIFEFDRHDTFIVGRAKAAQFRLSDDDEFFSRNHFLLEVNPPLCRIMDLSSTNGTRVNGKKIQSVDLKHGDIIRGGLTKLRVSMESEPETSAEAPPEPQKIVGDATLVPKNRPAANASPNGESPHKRNRANVNPKQVAPTLVPHANNDLAKENNDAFDAASGPLPAFPGYTTRRVLGRGGMGVVYEAESAQNWDIVAIKVIHPHVAALPSDVSRFLREALILKELRHPNIVRFRDLNQVNGTPYIVMDYVDGKNTDAVLKSGSAPISRSRAVSLTLQLLDALQYAHDKGYVHRDVKPTNLLIVSDGKKEKALLADFGLSRAYQSSKLSGLTMTGDIGGSTPFMPPEQITNYRNVEPSADQYSAAATLYYLLTGAFVYEHPRDVPKQLLMILQDSIVPLEKRRRDLPASLVKVIHKALSRDPSARYSSASEFAAALRPFAPSARPKQKSE